MAAGDSPTSVSNLSLAMLSEAPILNVDPPDNSRAGRLCAQFYDPSRRAILEGAPWRCAKRDALLAASAALPELGGRAAYPLPADYIRLYELPHDERRRWEVMNLERIGPCIVTHMTGGPLLVSYVFDLRDTTQMTALLIRSIAAEMASGMAIPLTRDTSLRQAAVVDRDNYLAQARSVSAQQASPRPMDVDVMLRSRW